MNQEQVEQNRKSVQDWYHALAEGDSAKMLGLQWGDVIYNIHGTTPVSGRFQGNDTLVREVFPKVLSKITPKMIKVIPTIP